MLEFRQNGQNGGLVVCLDGTLTKDNVVSVKDKIEKEILGKLPREVIIDLSGATSMDTAGVALLIVLCRICKKKKINFRITNPDEKVRKVIRLAHLEKLLLGNGEPNVYQ